MQARTAGLTARTRAVVWVGALGLSLTFLASDSAVRLHGIRSVSGLDIGTASAPSPDPDSPSGYAAGQHRLILPAQGTDGYHWILQTEQMLADGDLRVRAVDYDAADGRAVHWSGAVRWWLASVAWIYQRFHPELALPLAIEHVAPWAGTLLLAFFILALTPVIVRRFDPVAGALFALGCVAAHPFYQYSVTGFLDHHGLAAMSCLAAVILLLIGGAGWVRTDPDDTDAGSAAPASASRKQPEQWPDQSAVRQRLPAPGTARRCFIAAAAAGAAGLWISAATTLPVLIGIGLGAVAGMTLVPGAPRGAHWRFDSGLWRVWGVAGAVFSMAFHLLEYFPDHLGMRLEVNHPLHALSWLGAGDLLYRLGRRIRYGAADHAWLLADALLIAALPAAMLIGGSATFVIADPFLWALHHDYILEFRTLFTEFERLNAWHILQGTTNVLPLLALPLSAVLWKAPLHGMRRHVWRALLCALIAGAILFTHAFFLPAARALLRGADAGSAAVHLVCLVPDAAVFMLLFLWPARSRMPPLPGPGQGLLLLALLPALLLLAMSFRQIRWLGVDWALWLAVMVGARGVLAGLEWSRRHRLVARALLVLVLLPYPLFTMVFPWQLGYPAVVDATQLVARDVSHLLRARMGDDRGVILSSPTATTWMIYFGGLSGIGTLYWENIDGLQTAAAIYGAPTPAAARRLITENGITHIVVYSWDAFALEYGRLARERQLARRAPAAEPSDAFILQLLGSSGPPPWLTRIPYDMPAISILANSEVRIFEVVRSDGPTGQ